MFRGLCLFKRIVEIRAKIRRRSLMLNQPADQGFNIMDLTLGHEARRYMLFIGPDRRINISRRGSPPAAGVL